MSAQTRAKQPVDWDAGWRYSDTSGTLAARVVCVADGMLRMERWPKKNPRRITKFEIPVGVAATDLSTIRGWTRQ